MPSWNDLLLELQAQPSDDAKAAWLNHRHVRALQSIAARRGGRNVIVYSSAFLQKPQAPPLWLMISPEDINGFMSVVFGMDFSKGLTLILHTPGGVTNAAETIVAYLWSKFPDIEVIVPTYAMSAGTMISLAANRILMGRQSQLGPIDPQMQIGGQSLPARAVVDQFRRAKREVLSNPVAAHVWAPVLASIGPALLQEARNALAYSERMVAQWLAQRMFAGLPDAAERGKHTAAHFNDASVHKSHGRRIDRDEARAHGIAVEDLEVDQALQDDVLTAYHLSTIIFEHTPAAKMMASHAGRFWMKNLGAP